MRRLASFTMVVAVLGLAFGCGKKDSTESGGGGGGAAGGTGGGGGGSSSIEGTYIIVGMEMNGKAQAEAEITKEPEAKRTMKITADKMIMMKGGKEDPATYKLDNSKTPHEIDLTGKETTGPKGKEKEKEEKMYGIYKLEGEKLTLCIAMSDKAADRPKEFKTSADAKTFVMMMTLQKKK